MEFFGRETQPALRLQLRLVLQALCDLEQHAHVHMITQALCSVRDRLEPELLEIVRRYTLTFQQLWADPLHKLPQVPEAKNSSRLVQLLSEVLLGFARVLYNHAFMLAVLAASGKDGGPLLIEAVYSCMQSVLIAFLRTHIFGIGFHETYHDKREEAERGGVDSGVGGIGIRELSGGDPFFLHGTHTALMNNDKNRGGVLLSVLAHSSQQWQLQSIKKMRDQRFFSFSENLIRTDTHISNPAEELGNDIRNNAAEGDAKGNSSHPSHVLYVPCKPHVHHMKALIVPLQHFIECCDFALQFDKMQARQPANSASIAHTTAISSPGIVHREI